MTATTAPPSSPPPAGPATPDHLRGSASSDRWRRRIVRVMLLIIVVAVIAGGVVAVMRSRSSNSASVAPVAQPTTGTLTVKNITNDATFDGTVFHATATAIQAYTSGHITALTPVGTAIDNGGPLYSIDGSPTVLMIGAVPVWRDMTPASTPGADIGQLQNSLKALGFDPDNQITANGTFDSPTAAAVVRWQEHLGVTATGNVLLGAVIFEPSAITMGAQFVTIGAAVGPGTAIADAQVTGINMQFTLPADTKTLIAIGQTVDVTMPDRTTSKGTIQSIGASTDSSGNPITVGRGTVQPPKNPAAVTDGAAIKVRISQSVATNVLVAPATAITAHVDGTFTINVIQPDGSFKSVPVKLGLSSNGSVQVTGDGLAAGVKVQLPANV